MSVKGVKYLLIAVFCLLEAKHCHVNSSEGVSSGSSSEASFRWIQSHPEKCLGLGYGKNKSLLKRCPLLTLNL